MLITEKKLRAVIRQLIRESSVIDHNQELDNNTSTPIQLIVKNDDFKRAAKSFTVDICKDFAMYGSSRDENNNYNVTSPDNEIELVEALEVYFESFLSLDSGSIELFEELDFYLKHMIAYHLTRNYSLFFRKNGKIKHELGNFISSERFLDFSEYSVYQIATKAESILKKEGEKIKKEILPLIIEDLKIEGLSKKEADKTIEEATKKFSIQVDQIVTYAFKYYYKKSVDEGKLHEISLKNAIEYLNFFWNFKE